MNPFIYSNNNKRYHSYSYYLSQHFGVKVSRISLNGGFSCPNLDGTKGSGGCSYCSVQGSGEFGGNPHEDISKQFATIKARMNKKWDTDTHIAYFQARTNTYAPIETLKRLYLEALNCPGVVGISVATRPDCLPDDVCDLLEEISHKTYLVVELGLQTIHDKTGEAINRCHSYYDFLSGYEKLKQRNILVGVHLINGLPGETHEMMLESARAMADLKIHLIKIHLLHVLDNTKLANEYRKGSFMLMARNEYVSVVCDQLELLPPEFVVGRLTGDGAPEDLIGPIWSLKKLCVLNEIDKEFVLRNSWQGKLTKCT